MDLCYTLRHGKPELQADGYKAIWHFCCYYDKGIVLLGTGIHISEMMGLTFSDLDFKECKIRMDHQLTKIRGGKYYMEKTNTTNGIRFIYMTDEVQLKRASKESSRS